MTGSFSGKFQGTSFSPLKKGKNLLFFPVILPPTPQQPPRFCNPSHKRGEKTGRT